MVDVVLVLHMGDGSTVAKAWSLPDDRVAELEGWLGEPDQQQLLDPRLSEAADRLAARSVVLGD